jgi:hypothetical protein
VKSQVIKATAGGFAAVLVAAAVAIPSASASGTGAVPFGQANFNGYATGTEMHIDATALNSLSSGAIPVANIDQGFSAVSTNTSGLTNSLTGELGSVLQPVEPATVKAFDAGAGLKVDLGSLAPSQLLSAVQQLVPDQVVAIAPPDGNPLSDNFNLPDLSPIVGPAGAGVLGGQAAAGWPTDTCGSNVLSYGLGNAADLHFLSLSPLTATGTQSGIAAPLISTGGTTDQTSISQSKSQALLTKNADGTYGISTVASDIIAPIHINILGLATLDIAVKSAGGVDDPVSLTALTTGEGSGASVVPSTDDILTVTLTPAGQAPVTLANVDLASLIGKGPMDIPISTSALPVTLQSLTTLLQNTVNTVSGIATNVLPAQVASAIQAGATQLNSALQTVSSQVQQNAGALLSTLSGLVNINLGDIVIDDTPHAIGGSTTSAPTVVGGTQAGGAMDLLNVTLGLSNSSVFGQALPNISLAEAKFGHLETASNLASPIAAASCSTPTPTTLVQQAGSQPQVAPAKLPFTGGPGGLWQPALGVGTLGLGGFSLALVRRLRKRSAA